MEILGLLDALESMLLDGFKIPLTKKTVVNEEKILAVIDKIRLVVQGGGDFAKKAISGKGGKIEFEAPQEDAEVKDAAKQGVTRLLERGQRADDSEGKAIEVLQQAYQIAHEVRYGADKYADEVLANIEATSSRILRAVRAGREKLQKFKGDGGQSQPAPSQPKNTDHPKNS